MLKILIHPCWVIVTGCALAFLGAAVNAYYLIELGTSVSHLTGDVSKVAMTAADGRVPMTGAAIQLIAATVGFLLGAASAGFFIHHPNIEFARPYGRSIIFIGLCLLVAHFTLRLNPLLSILFASFGCGFQNALATHYRGMVLRTTHITGLLTDLGTQVGMKLRGHRIPNWKLFVPGLLVLGFFMGATVGSYVVLSMHRPILLPVAVIYLASGLFWSLFKHLSILPDLSKH